MIALQIKWNNPEEYEDMFDSSGISLYYTKNLRRYDVGTKIFSSTHFTIPSPRPIYAITSSYPSECSQMQIKSPIYITRAFNHMHKYGKKRSRFMSYESEGKIYSLFEIRHYISLKMIDMEVTLMTINGFKNKVKYKGNNYKCDLIPIIKCKNVQNRKQGITKLG